MNLTFQVLKKYFPELNRKVITRERIVQVLGKIGIPVYELPMEGRGAYVHDTEDKKDYVFIKYNLSSLIYHETLAYEGVHALCHVPAATFLKSKHELQSEVLSLVMMMPATELPRLNRIKHQLEPESYEMVQKRNQIKSFWRI